MKREIKRLLEARKFARKPEVLALWFPGSAATLYRRIRDGSFPASIKISPGISAWDVEQLEAWSKAHRGS
jgi:predicted DNA-binding transcriptional regulator AlpA